MFENEHFSKKITKFVVSKVLIFTVLTLANNGNVFAVDQHEISSVDNESLSSADNVIVDESSSDKIVQPLKAVTVIGSRLPSFQTPINEIPSNVSYISKSGSSTSSPVYDSQPRNFQDTVRGLEGGVFYDDVGNGVDETFSLRGFADSSAVIFLVDGVRVNKVDGDSVNFPLLPMSDIESVQVNRGSSSQTYGSNAFAGVIHLTTGEASEKPFSLFGGMKWSSFDGLRFNQGVSGTLQDKITPVGGKFKYYFNGGRDTNDGFRDNGEWRITSFNIKTEYELPDDQGSVSAGIKHVDDAISNPGALTVDMFKVDPEQTLKNLDGRKMKETIVQVGADKKFWDNRILASVLASSRHNRVDFFTTSVTAIDFTDGFNPDTDLVTTKNRAGDLVWQLTYQDVFKWFENQSMFGMEMRDASNQALERDAFLGRVVNSTATETDRISSPKSIGIFWRETIKVFEKVIAHFGMRHDFNWLNTIDHLTPANNISRRWKSSSLSTGITVKPVSFWDVFWNYSEGFRVPTISEILPFAGTISNGLNPERSDSHEFGTRIRLKEKAEAKASFFLIDLKDEIVFDSTTRGVAAPFGQNINVSETRRMGVELRLDAQPIQEVTVYGSYTWTKAYVREINRAGTLRDGASLGQIPEHRFTMGVNSRPLKRLGKPFEGLRVGMNGVFTGKQHPVSFESVAQATLNATNGFGHIIKPYSVWDFIVAYDWKGSEVYFKINNVFDEEYYSRSVNATVFGFGGGSNLLPPGSFNFVNPGAPREFILGSRWEFDTLGDLFYNPVAA